MTAALDAIVEWQDETRPWARHDAPLPIGVRLPVVGDYIVLPDESARLVKTVFIGLDGHHVVRCDFHPQQEKP